MASPDFSQYIDLTIYDIDAYQVYNDAIVYARDAVPEFQPRSGTLEEAIMQAMAYNTALLSSQINRLPDGLMEGIARLIGLERLEATFATGEAVFEVFDDNGVTIPSGTVVAYETSNDDVAIVYAFETISDLVIAEGSTTGSVGIQALDAGVYPALLAMQELELVSPAPGVIGVTLASAINVGTNSETDSGYFTRAAQYLASLSSSLTTRTQMLNFIRSRFPFVGALAIFDLTYSVNLEWSQAPAPGYVTIVMTDISGNPLGPIDLAQIASEVSSKMVAGLMINTADPSPVDVVCNVDIVVSDGYDSTETRNAVNAYLTSRFSTLGYDFSGTIIKNEIISAIANITGVRYVKSIVLDTADITKLTVDPVSGDLNFVYKNGTPNGIIEVTSS